MPARPANATTRRCLDAGEISKILADAVTHQAALRVRLQADTPPREMSGAIVRRDGPTMVVKLSGEALSITTRGTPVFSVVWWMKGVQYAFETTGAGHRDDDDIDDGGRVLRLNEPLRIDILERRRTSRRWLQGRSVVHLQPANLPPEVPLAEEADDRPPLSAVMMNVSPQGLACRLEASVAKRLSVRTKLVATFSVESGDQTFVFPGRIVSITPGGTPGQSIVGIEFVDDGSSRVQEEALDVALHRSLDGGARTGVSTPGE